MKLRKRNFMSGIGAQSGDLPPAKLRKRNMGREVALSQLHERNWCSKRRFTPGEVAETQHGTESCENATWDMKLRKRKLALAWLFRIASLFIVPDSDWSRTVMRKELPTCVTRRLETSSM